jgi:anaphase-promoting complex subunit 3
MSFEERDEAESHLLGLYSKIGEGCYALSKYDCEHSLTIFRSLSASQANTPYVMSRIARALYESRNLSEVFFNQALICRLTESFSPFVD